MSGTVPGVVVIGGLPVVGLDKRARVSGCCGCGGGTDPVPPGSVTLYFRACCQQIFCNGQPVELPVYRFVFEEGDPLITEIVRRDVERQRRMFFKYGDLCMRYARVEDGLLTPANSVLGDRSALVYFPNLLVNGDGTCPPGVCSCTDLVVLGTRCDGGSDILSTGKRAASCPARFCQVGGTFDQMPGDLSPRSYCFSFNSGSPLVQYNQTLHQLIGGFYGDCCECCRNEPSQIGLTHSNRATFQSPARCCCGQRQNQFGFLEPSTECTGCLTAYAENFADGNSVTLLGSACGPIGGTASANFREVFNGVVTDFTANVPVQCGLSGAPQSIFSGIVYNQTFSITGSCAAQTGSGTNSGASLTTTWTITCTGTGPCGNRCLGSVQWPTSPNDPGGLL